MAPKPAPIMYRRLQHGSCDTPMNEHTWNSALRLRDVGALWLHGHAPQRNLVEVACELLAEGREGDGIARLAGHPFGDEADTLDVEEDLRAAVQDLGVDLPDRETDELLHLSIRAMCRRHLAGEVPARELAEWAHRIVGHTEPQFAQPLVVADDEYDLIESGVSRSRGPGSITMADVDARVRRAAVSLAQE